MDVLISGAGIAGPTLAYWLTRYGHTPTLLEEAPALRTAGYVIDFWGAGFDIAEKMGLIPKLMSAGYVVEEVRLVDDKGDRVGGFPVRDIERLAGGRYVSIARGELAAATYSSLQGKVETIFGERICSLRDCGCEVQATFIRMKPRKFDLVIGADGLHSNVRALVFDSRSQFERYLGYKVAAFEASGYRPRDELTYVSYSRPGMQAARFALRGDRTLFLLIYADSDPTMPAGNDLSGQKKALRQRFKGRGWECDDILAVMNGVPSIYFDRVSQIRTPAWSKGRVALIGDAASAPSLLAGQGAALAMTQAYVLAGELDCSQSDHAVAFARYESRLRHFLATKQSGAKRFATSLVPKSEFGLQLRNLITRFMGVPFVAEMALNAQLRDALQLPAYSAAA